MKRSHSGENIASWSQSVKLFVDITLVWEDVCVVTLGHLQSHVRMFYWNDSPFIICDISFRDKESGVIPPSCLSECKIPDSGAAIHLDKPHLPWDQQLRTQHLQSIASSSEADS